MAGGFRRIFATLALAAAFAIVGVVGYTILRELREPKPPEAVTLEAGPKLFPSSPQPARKDSPAASSANPALPLGDSLVPVIPSPPSNAAPARTGAPAKSMVFGLTGARPRDDARDAKVSSK